MLRHVEGLPLPAVAARCELWRARGFLNYFGLQRFGATSVSSHHLGRLLIARKWEQASRLARGEGRSGAGRGGA